MYNGYEKVSCSNRFAAQIRFLNICFKFMVIFSVRLTDGKDNAGIVEYVDNDKWVGFCNDGFTTDHARQICIELGHQNGTLLPPGAYGKYYKQLGRPYIKCNGNESSIMECGYNTQVDCSASQYNYVSICCHDNKTETGKILDFQ